MFGEPRRGAHAWRICGVAAVDTLAALALALALHWLFPSVPTWTAILGVFLLGVCAHRLFCVRTAIDRALFPQ